MSHIMTVKGPIEPQHLGVTYAHEHLLCTPPEGSPEAGDPDFTMLSPEAAASELGLFKRAGGQSMVEMSPVDYSRRSQQLRELSTQTGIQIINFHSG